MRRTAALLLILLFASLATANPPASGQTQQSSAPIVDWQKRYGGDGLTWIGQAPDSGFVFFYPGYYSTYYGPAVESATLTKVDYAGNIQWIKNFSLPFPENFIETKDGGFAYTTLNDSVLTISKLDSNGNSQWNQTCGSPLSGSRLLIQTSDDGFAVSVHNDTGYVRIGDAYFDARALMIFKTDTQGKIQWTKTLDSLNSSYNFRSLIQTIEGGYALAGSFGSSLGEFPLSPPISNASDFCLAKISSAGDLQWTKIYGGANDDDANSFVQTKDGGYALVGSTRSFGAGASDALLVKTDASGNLVWAQAYGGCPSAKYLDFKLNLTGEHDDSANAVIETNDGGLAFAGATQWDWPNSNNMAWLVATDANGNVKWNQAFSDVTYNFFGSTDGMNWDLSTLIQAKDGSLVMGGYASTGFRRWERSSYLIKTKPAVPILTTSSTPSPMPSLAFQPITINADGSITPANAPITQVGNEYKLTEDIHNPLIVKAENIIINGQGHLLNGNGTIGNLFILKSQIALDLLSAKNVKTFGVSIQNFKIGILVENSINITISKNTLAQNNQGVLGIESANVVVAENEFSNRYQEGIRLTSCLNSEVTGNKLTENGIAIFNSNGAVISGNDFNQGGVGFSSSKNALIAGNVFDKSWVANDISDSPDITVAANNYSDCNIAISAGGVPGTLFYMNNFINTTWPPDMNRGGSDDEGNLLFTKETWDNGTVGNYWDNYTLRYPNAQQEGNSGTWNSPYVISENNTDYHPLVNPVSSDAALTLAQTLISNHIASTPSPSPTPTQPISTSPSPSLTPTPSSSPLTTATPAQPTPLPTSTLTTIAVAAAAVGLVLVVGLIFYRKKNKTGLIQKTAGFLCQESFTNSLLGWLNQWLPDGYG